ncbi:MAG: hypothetical protein WAW60_03955 [Candidatus Saccharimonadales bacterium]
MNSKKIVLGLAIVSVSALLGYFGTSMILGSKGASDNQKQPTDTSTTRTTSTDNSNGVDAMLIKLVDADKKPIANTFTSVFGPTKLQCIQQPCPTTEQKWRGKTDDTGAIKVPYSIVLGANDIKPDGYNSMPLQEDMVRKMDYQLQFSR